MYIYIVFLIYFQEKMWQNWMDGGGRGLYRTVYTEMHNAFESGVKASKPID